MPIVIKGNAEEAVFEPITATVSAKLRQPGLLEWAIDIDFERGAFRNTRFEPRLALLECMRAPTTPLLPLHFALDDGGTLYVGEHELIESGAMDVVSAHTSDPNEVVFSGTGQFESNFDGSIERYGFVVECTGAFLGISLPAADVDTSWIPGHASMEVAVHHGVPMLRFR